MTTDAREPGGTLPRVHTAAGWCPVCGGAAPEIGSPCVVYRLPRVHQRLVDGACRREVLRVCAASSTEELLIEAARLEHGSGHLLLYVDIRTASEDSRRGQLYDTGLRNGWPDADARNEEASPC